MAENSAEVARAYVLIVPSLQGAQKRITEELVPEAEAAGKEAGEKSGHHLKEGVAKAAKLAAAAFTAAMAGAVALIKQSLDAYAETEQLAGGIQKLFGDDAAAQVMSNAAQAYKTAGISANDYLKTVTGLSASLLASGVTAEEAAALADRAMRDMADNANTFGTKSAEELAQVYQSIARGSYAMLDNLALGYGGSKTGMEQLIKDANAYAKATGRAADLTIDSYADIVTAIGLVQEKMGIAGTTAKEAEGTIAGSLGMLRASWENLVAGFGDPGADIEELVAHVMGSFESAANNILPTVKRIGAALLKALPDLLRQVLEFLPTILPDLIAATVEIAQMLAQELPGIIEILINTIADNLELFIGAAIDIAIGLVEAVPRLIEVLVEAIPKIIDGITSVFEDPTKQEDFILAAVAVATAVANAAPRILESLISAVPTIIRGLTGAFQSPESQAAFAEAGKELGRALMRGLFSIASFSPAGWLAQQVATPGTSANTGFNDWLTGGVYSASQPSTPSYTVGMNGVGMGGGVTIGTVNLNTPNSATAASVFAQIRTAAALGGA